MRTPTKPPAAHDTQEKVDALMFLAREFAADGCPLQAAKCYEAICNKTHMNVLPLPEARARVQLSYLLLEFTDNVHRAKTHLETTVPCPAVPAAAFSEPPSFVLFFPLGGCSPSLSLLLSHTRSLSSLSPLVLSQQMLLRNIHGYESLKCSTFSGLSKCYKCVSPLPSPPPPSSHSSENWPE
jgi:hypothetical protein